MKVMTNQTPVAAVNSASSPSVGALECEDILREDADHEVPGTLLDVAARITNTPFDGFNELSPARAKPLLVFGVLAVMAGAFLFFVSTSPAATPEQLPSSLAASVAGTALLGAGIVSLLRCVPPSWYGNLATAIHVGSITLTVMGTVALGAVWAVLIWWSGWVMLEHGSASLEAIQKTVVIQALLWALVASMHPAISTTVESVTVVRVDRCGDARVKFVVWPVHATAVRSALMWVAAAFVGVNLWNALAEARQASGVGAITLPVIALVTITLGVLSWFTGRRRGVETTRRELAKSVTDAYVQSVKAYQTGKLSDQRLLAARLLEVENELCSAVNGHSSCRRGSRALVEVVRYVACVLLSGVPDNRLLSHRSHFEKIDQLARRNLLGQTMRLLASIRSSLVGPTCSVESNSAEAAPPEQQLEPPVTS